MGRRVKEFIDIAEFNSLDDLIGQLVELRESLPEQSEPELKLRGDDVFGRKLSIAFFREQTAEEAATEARYAESYREARAREIEASDQDLAAEPARPKRRKLRIVA
mgnify:CR=1 FL=1